MARPLRIFWFASFAVAAYLLWRWRTQRVAEALPPAPPSPTPPTSPAPALRADASGTPRRIPTRVHRGAPPAFGERAKQLAEQVQGQVAEVAEQVRETATEAVEQARETVTELAEQAQETAAEVVEQARETAAEAVEQAQETAAEVAEEVQERAADIGSSRAVGETTEADHTLATAVDAPPAAVEPTEPVNVNTADLETLIALPGIGAVLAERIVRYRTDNGPFQQIEELTEVPGIGARNLATFRHLITV